MDPLQQALELLAQSEGVIAALLDENQKLKSGNSSKPEETNGLQKQAEELAVELDLSFDEASNLVKQANEQNIPVDILQKSMKIAQRINNVDFGKVASDNNSGVPTTARERYLAGLAEIEA